MADYAEEVLYSVHSDLPEADKYVKKMIHELSIDQLGTSQKFDFWDFSLDQGDNNIFKSTLTKKMKFQDLLLSMSL